MKIIKLEYSPPAPTRDINRIELIVEDDRIRATAAGFRRAWWVTDFAGGDFKPASLASALRELADLVEKVAA